MSLLTAQRHNVRRVETEYRMCDSRERLDSIRGTAHGISAASGKLGALAPAILYNYIPTHTRFWVVPWFGILGLLLTVIFMPDT